MSCEVITWRLRWQQRVSTDTWSDYLEAEMTTTCIHRHMKWLPGGWDDNNVYPQTHEVITWRLRWQQRVSTDTWSAYLEAEMTTTCIHRHMKWLPGGWDDNNVYPQTHEVITWRLRWQRVSTDTWSDYLEAEMTTTCIHRHMKWLPGGWDDNNVYPQTHEVITWRLRWQQRVSIDTWSDYLEVETTTTCIHRHMKWLPGGWDDNNVYPQTHEVITWRLRWQQRVSTDTWSDYLEVETTQRVSTDTWSDYLEAEMTTTCIHRHMKWLPGGWDDNNVYPQTHEVITWRLRWQQRVSTDTWSDYLESEMTTKCIHRHMKWLPGVWDDNKVYPQTHEVITWRLKRQQRVSTDTWSDYLEAEMTTCIHRHMKWLPGGWDDNKVYPQTHEVITRRLRWQQRVSTDTWSDYLEAEMTTTCIHRHMKWLPGGWDDNNVYPQTHEVITWRLRWQQRVSTDTWSDYLEAEMTTTCIHRHMKWLPGGWGDNNVYPQTHEVITWRLRRQQRVSTDTWRDYLEAETTTTCIHRHMTWLPGGWDDNNVYPQTHEVITWRLRWQQRVSTDTWSDYLEAEMTTTCIHRHMKWLPGGWDDNNVYPQTHEGWHGTNDLVDVCIVSARPGDHCSQLRVAQRLPTRCYLVVTLNTSQTKSS